MTVTIERAAEERKAAAAARAAGAEQQGYFRSQPAGLVINHPCGTARSLPFKAEMRAIKREWNGKQMVNLVGIASVTDTPYEMYDAFGPYEEIIDRGAFTETLAADPDVSFLVNHRGMTMARTRAKEGLDRTLTLRMVDEGLESDAWVNPKRQDVADLVTAIDDGNIDQMSFSFMLEEGWWSDDFETFKISRLDLDRGDTSAVNYGANPYTSIAARSREILAELDYLPAGAKQAALRRLSQDSPMPIRASVRPEPTGTSIQAVNAWLLQHQ